MHWRGGARFAQTHGSALTLTLFREPDSCETFTILFPVFRVFRDSPPFWDTVSETEWHEWGHSVSTYSLMHWRVGGICPLSLSSSGFKRRLVCRLRADHIGWREYIRQGLQSYVEEDKADRRGESRWPGARVDAVVWKKYEFAMTILCFAFVIFAASTLHVRFIDPGYRALK